METRPNNYVLVILTLTFFLVVTLEASDIKKVNSTSRNSEEKPSAASTPSDDDTNTDTDETLWVLQQDPSTTKNEGDSETSSSEKSETKSSTATASDEDATFQTSDETYVVIEKKKKKTPSASPLSFPGEPLGPDYSTEVVLRGEGPNMMWVKGKTESFLISQSEGPTQTFEMPESSQQNRPSSSLVYQKKKKPQPMGGMLSILRLPWKRPPPPHHHPSSPSPSASSTSPVWARRTETPLTLRPRPQHQQPMNKVVSWWRKKMRPHHQLTKNKKGGGRIPVVNTAPEIMRFCLRNSERCTWSERDKSLVLIEDENKQRKSAKEQVGTPPSLMKFCLRNSGHCHWSERDRRWYLVDIVKEVGEY